MTITKSALYPLLFGIGTGLLYYFIFLFKIPGISFLIFFLVLSAISLFPAKFGNSTQEQKLINAIPTFLYVLGITLSMLYRLDALHMAVTIATFPFIHLGTVLFVNRGISLNTIVKIKLFEFMKSTIDSVFKGFSYFKSLRNPAESAPKRDYSSLKKVFIGALISFPVTFYVLLLLISADSAFSTVIGNLVSSIFNFDLFNYQNIINEMLKLGILFASSIFFTVWYSLIWDQESTLNTFEVKEAPEIDKLGRWNHLTVLGFITPLNFIFLLFVIVQFTYLFGGQSNIIGLDASFTYAEYARRGFWELLAVAFIIFAVVWNTIQRVQLFKTASSYLYQMSIVLLNFFMIIITYSAYRRLALYTETYGSTILRTYVFYGIISIGIIFLVALASSLWNKGIVWVKNTVVTLALITVFLFFTFPTDYFVANSNATRFRETGKIDVLYLTTLNDEAVPVMVDLFEELDGKDKLVLQANLIYRSHLWESQREDFSSYNWLFEFNKSAVKSLTFGEGS